MRLSILIFAFLPPACSDTYIDLTPDGDADVVEYEGDSPGECSDRADNDRDGLFDCDDPGCAGSPDCADQDAGTDADADEDDGGEEVDALEVVEDARPEESSPEDVVAEDAPDDVADETPPPPDCTIWTSFEPPLPLHDDCNTDPFQVWAGEPDYCEGAPDTWEYAVCGMGPCGTCVRVPGVDVPCPWYTPDAVVHSGVRSMWLQGHGAVHRATARTPNFTVSVWFYVPTVERASGIRVLTPCGWFVSEYDAAGVETSHVGMTSVVYWRHDEWIRCDYEQSCDGDTIVQSGRVEGVEVLRTTISAPCGWLAADQSLASFTSQLSDAAYRGVPVGPVFVDDYCYRAPDPVP